MTNLTKDELINLTKDELIKLAELAGYRYQHLNSEWILKPEGDRYLTLDQWQPDKDIKQAMECLGTFKDYTIHRRIRDGDTYIVHIFNSDGSGQWLSCETGSTLCEAVCKAILKALEGE